MPELFGEEHSEWGNFEWIEPIEDETEPKLAPDEVSKSPAEHKNRLFWRYTALGALIFTGGFGWGMTYERNQRPTSIPPIAGANINDDTRPCPTVPQREINKVVKIVHQPENPRIIKLMKESKESYGIGNNSDPGLVIGFDAIARQAAAANGLHLAQTMPYQFKMLDANTFAEQFKLINDYARQFGFKVDVDFNKSDGVQPLDKSKVQPEDYYQAFLRLMATFRYVPVEVVKATGLKHLRIVKDFVTTSHHVSDVAADAYGGDHVDISLSDLLRGSRTDLDHEMGHDFDYNWCGEFGFEHFDPQFTNLNPADFEYGTGGEWRDATISQYGASNQMEDKAELLRHILPGIDSRVVHSRYPAVRQKYELLLARLNEKVPGAVEYLQQISR